LKLDRRISLNLMAVEAKDLIFCYFNRLSLIKGIKDLYLYYNE